MKRMFAFGLIVLSITLNCAFTSGGEEGLVAHWKFNEGKGKIAVEFFDTIDTQFFIQVKEHLGIGL